MHNTGDAWVGAQFCLVRCTFLAQISSNPGSFGNLNNATPSIRNFEYPAATQRVGMAKLYVQDYLPNSKDVSIVLCGRGFTTDCVYVTSVFAISPKEHFRPFGGLFQNGEKVFILGLTILFSAVLNLFHVIYILQFANAIEMGLSCHEPFKCIAISFNWGFLDDLLLVLSKAVVKNIIFGSLHHFKI